MILPEMRERWGFYLYLRRKCGQPAWMAFDTMVRVYGRLLMAK
jgi:hypothetical protein